MQMLKDHSLFRKQRRLCPPQLLMVFGLMELVPHLLGLGGVHSCIWDAPACVRTWTGQTGQGKSKAPCGSPVLLIPVSNVKSLSLVRRSVIRLTSGGSTLTSVICLLVTLGRGARGKCYWRRWRNPRTLFSARRDTFQLRICIGHTFVWKHWGLDMDARGTKLLEMCSYKQPWSVTACRSTQMLRRAKYYLKFWNKLIILKYR